MNYRWIIYLGKFDHDLHQRPKAIDDGECKGIIPVYGCNIQVSEILQFTQNDVFCFQN